MIDQAFIAAANHLLRDADWALERLRLHAGKHALLAIGGVTLDFSVAADGLLAAPQPQHAAQVTVSVPLALVPRWLADRNAASREVAVEGDSEFAAAISYVAANLRWDFEEDLSRVLGDIVAHRVGEAVRSVERWRGATMRAAQDNLAEYLTEEKGVLPTRQQAERFMQEVEELRDAVERLDKRLARLETRPHR